MIETPHLTIADRQLEDIPTEELYLNLYPEIKELDPSVGESINPTFYSIFTKELNKHIGLCCLYNFTTTEVELGVRIFITDYWNKGYGSEVVNALCEYVFNSCPQIMTVLAKTPVYNIRAVRCYEKCGFTQYSRALLSGYDMIFMMKSREVEQ